MRHEAKGGFLDYEMILVSFILMEMDTLQCTVFVELSRTSNDYLIIKSFLFL